MDTTELWYLHHYIGEGRVCEIFERIDKNYKSLWDVPFDRVDSALQAAYNAYWNAIPGPRKSGGIASLCQPGPGELDHVVKSFAKDYTINLKLQLDRKSSSQSAQFIRVG